MQFPPKKRSGRGPINCMKAVAASPVRKSRTGFAPRRKSSLGIGRSDYIRRPLVLLHEGGIAMDCLICRDLKRAFEFRRNEYFQARSAVYYQVSTELAAYKNVEMERARSNWEEHQVVCGHRG